MTNIKPSIVKTCISVFYLLILNFLCFACAQEKNDNPAESITIEELRDHIFYLASDSLRGRMPGTEGFNIAAGYAISQFVQSGLDPVCTDSGGEPTYFQPVMLYEYELDLSNTELIVTVNGNEYPFEVSDHFAMGNGGSFDQNEVTGQAVFVGYGIHEPDRGWDDYQGVVLKDKWAVMLDEIPDSVITEYLSGVEERFRSVFTRLVSAYDAGALGVIILCSDNLFDNLRNRFNKGYTLPQTGSPPFSYNCPSIFINSTITRLLMQGQLFDPLSQEGEYSSCDMKGTEITLKKVYHTTRISSGNIVAVVNGTDPELKNEFITAGAHLDHIGVVSNHIYNGADDNASGSAAILEIAEAVARSRPKRSVLFLLYTGEEMGMLGSYHFVNHTPVPLETMKVNINLDMIGHLNGIASDLIALTAEKMDPGLKNVVNEVNRRTVNLVLDSTDYTSYFDRSDHYSFYLAGIPYILFSTGEHGLYHTPGDDAEKIDYDFLEQVSKMTYEVIMELANDPDCP
ncbi:MAG: M28 family peptidase [Bacteroidales bacterium]|nr:M28 family peptidase [Bacteroidales bacterium]